LALESIFRKSVNKFQVQLKPDKNNRCFTWRPIYTLIISRTILLWTRNVSEKFVQKVKTIFFFKSCHLKCNMEKYCSAGQATAHAHCILSNWGYKHTLRTCNTCRFPAATMVARTLLSVTLYTLCLCSCICRWNRAVWY
jgi:hypothetical protein